MFGRKVNNMNDLYFVVRVWYLQYNKEDKYQYQIVSERAYPMDKALDIKMAQDIMNTNNPATNCRWVFSFLFLCLSIKHQAPSFKLLD